MPTITALLHTQNDALRLGRALEMLFPCDEILIIDHDSRDGTSEVAREYGARVLKARPGMSYLQTTRGDWIFSLDPRESLTESLAASLYEWKTEHLAGSVSSFSVYLREETEQGWIANPKAQTRLVPADWSRWEKMFPTNDPAAVALEGDLLRFGFP